MDFWDVGRGLLLDDMLVTHIDSLCGTASC